MLRERKIYKVATLQDFGYPVVSLFAGMDSRQIYLFLSSDCKGRYMVIPVTQSDLNNYLNGKTNLRTLEANGIYEGVIENGEAFITNDTVPNCRKTLALYNEFDEDLYYDDMNVYSFLYDLNHNCALNLRQ